MSRIDSACLKDRRRPSPRRWSTAQPDRTPELARQRRITEHIGPPDPESSKESRNGKGTWREEARILAEHYPEEFREPAFEGRYDRHSGNTERSSAEPSSAGTEPGGEEGANCAFPDCTAAPAGEMPRAELQCPLIVPESSQRDRKVLPASAPIPPLPNSFWQGILFGSPDVLLSGVDASLAVRHLARQLGKDSDIVEFSEGVRAGALRRNLWERFGPVMAEQTMAALWRAASPGAPVPNEDQSRCSPGVRDCPAFHASLAPGVPSRGQWRAAVAGIHWRLVRLEL
jgi:hypothetical protein